MQSSIVNFDHLALPNVKFRGWVVFARNNLFSFRSFLINVVFDSNPKGYLTSKTFLPDVNYASKSCGSCGAATSCSTPEEEAQLPKLHGNVMSWDDISLSHSLPFSPVHWSLRLSFYISAFLSIDISSLYTNSLPVTLSLQIDISYLYANFVWLYLSLPVHRCILFRYKSSCLLSLYLFHLLILLSSICHVDIYWRLVRYSFFRS